MGIHLFDQFTLLHFATGVLAYFWSVPPLTFIIAHTVFEIVENTEIGVNFMNIFYVQLKGGTKLQADTLLNSIIGDTIGGLAGYFGAQWLDDLGNRLGWSRKLTSE